MALAEVFVSVEAVGSVMVIEAANPFGMRSISQCDDSNYKKYSTGDPVAARAERYYAHADVARPGWWQGQKSCGQ